MRAREFITEIKGCGDCFQVAGRAMITPEVPEMRLVHAYVTGQGPIAGKRFSHAWNEIGDVVLDYSNGRQVVMRKPQYYELGQVTTEPGEYAVYDDTQAKKRMVQTRHWGPWDLDPAKEKIDENFADGKVKGKSRPGRVKRAGASCAGSVTDLRARAKKSGGERGRMYHWCANMKSGRSKSKK